MNRALLFSFALVLGGCGGSQSPDQNQPGGGGGQATPVQKQTPEQTEREQKLAKLRAAQESACEKMCPEITDCAVEDARATMSEEELAKLNLEETAPRNTAQCNDKCKSSDLSPRQVRAIQECLTQGGDCKTFLACLDQVQKGADESGAGN